jgi:putative DNA-invertase from lambdoid prophage Rac
MPGGGNRQASTPSRNSSGDLLIERTQSGLKCAKAGGEVFGRPPTLTEAQRAAVREQIAAGTSVSALAKRYGTSRQTVMRARDAALR